MKYKKNKKGRKEIRIFTYVKKLKVRYNKGGK